MAGSAILGVTALYMARAVGTGVGPVASRAICGADPARAERIIGWSYLWAAALYFGRFHAADPQAADDEESGSD